MKAIKALLRWFSYLFHLVLGFFLLGVAGLALVSGSQAPHLGALPWSGPALTYALLIGAIAGLAALALAVTGKLRLPFFIWALAVAVLLAKSYVFSGYRFAPAEFKSISELIVASWLALAGAWPTLGRPARGHY